MGEKPILFNTRMVQAILDGRKTQTRRLIKRKYENSVLEMKTDKYGTRLIEIMKDEEGVTFGKHEDGTTWRKIRPYIEPQPAYKRGDILYVRETWAISRRILLYVSPVTGARHWSACSGDNPKRYIYRAGYTYIDDPGPVKWHPSIHMPKEAARIWLRVTEVRCERLKEITDSDAVHEGFEPDPDIRGVFMCSVDCIRGTPRGKFALLWNDTIPKDSLEEYGWMGNPWVWVYTFERIDNPREAKA